MKDTNGEELVQVMPESVNNQEACRKYTDDDIGQDILIVLANSKQGFLLW